VAQVRDDCAKPQGFSTFVWALILILSLSLSLWRLGKRFGCFSSAAIRDIEQEDSGNDISTALSCDFRGLFCKLCS
jgi:hypothetical protein